MIENSNRKLSRHPSVGKPLSGFAGLLMSACLVAVMTLWATSSPFSPVSQNSYVEADHKPVPMLQKVKDAFALSESVLPSPTVGPVDAQVQQQSPPVLSATITGVYEEATADEVARMEHKHALQHEDRTAWRSFRRQESMLVNKPLVRAMELPLRENLALDASNLPEVHFASAGPQPLPLQIDNHESEIVPRLPIQLSSSEETVNEKEEQPLPIAAVEPPARFADEQPPARVATLSDSLPYIAPFGNPQFRNQSTTRVLPIVPVERSKESWETGLY